jgi:heptosyltransferase I
MKTSAIDLAGATTVGLLPALLSRASLLITNDSGPMHIAAAVGTPVVALFGPTSAARTGPYGVGQNVLTGKVPCSPCFSRTCQNALPLECLRTVSPEQVLAAARSQRSQRMVPR